MIPTQQTTYYRRYSSQRMSELATWLAARASQAAPPKERTQDALVHELPARYSAQRRFSRVQIVVLLPLAFVLVPLFLLFRLEALRLAISLISGVYLLHLGFLFILTLLAGRKVQKGVALPLTNKQIEELAHEHWPRYSILVPLYRETAILPQLLRALKQIDYPQACLEILLLVEEDDYGMALTLSQADLSPVMRVVCVPQGYPRTKPRACNFGLAQATGDYLVIYDAEDIPDPLQLKRAVLTFAESHPRVACVQAQLNFYNAGANLLTRFFTLEYSLWFDLVLPGLVKLGAALPLGGTSNHFRTAVLRQLYGWDAYNVTEDADLGLRLSRYGFQTVVMEATTYEEATSQVGNWLGQRSRWIKGYIQTVLVQLRQPRKLLFSPKGLRQNGPTLGLVAGVSWFFLLNPLMWAMLLVYLVARTRVEDFYHAVFSPFALYAGVLCLFFGNLFFVVLAMCSAYRRRQYGLVPYALLLPFYWVLLSVAAARALYEFAVRPHHWQKTQHGLHLKGVQEFELADGSGQVEREFYFPANKGGPVELLTVQRSYESLTSRVKAIGTIPMPIIPQKRKGRGRGRYDLLFLTILTLASIMSILATIYYFQRHEITLYGDSLSHMRIARSVFDSATPGLAQLGTVWLPLPHILMWPFIWNDYLWHTGLAGSFVSMICFVVAAGFIYRILALLTKKRGLGVVGSLIFISNPNILYLQVTPLSESVCIAAFMATLYYFFCWVQEETLVSLILIGVAVFLATLARYDGWAVFLVFLLLIPSIDFLRYRNFYRALGQVSIYTLIGGCGIALWFLWNIVLFGDPRYFQEGPYSAQSQQVAFLQGGTFYTYHNWWEAIRTYTLTVIANIGLLPLLFTGLAILLIGVMARRNPLRLLSLVVLIPFIFYIVSMYTGQAIIHLPAALPIGVSSRLFNARYGIQLLAPCAILTAIGLSLLPKRILPIAQCSFLFLIGVQVVLMGTGNPITLQEGINNTCGNPQRQIDFYLAQHYNGGRILQDIFISIGYDESDTGIDFKNIIYQGSQSLWQEALVDPASVVIWVSFDPHSTSDLVAKSPGVHTSTFLKQFVLVLQEPNGRQLYYKRGSPALPTYPLSPDFLAPYQYCK